MKIIHYKLSQNTNKFNFFEKIYQNKKDNLINSFYSLYFNLKELNFLFYQSNKSPTITTLTNKKLTLWDTFQVCFIFLQIKRSQFLYFVILIFILTNL